MEFCIFEHLNVWACMVVCTLAVLFFLCGMAIFFWILFRYLFVEWSKMEESSALFVVDLANGL